MAKLNDQVKVFIVQQLACFQTPSQVSEAVRDQYGLELRRNRIQAYDPTKVQGASLSKTLTELFWGTREKFRQKITDIAISNQAYRLLTMQQALERAVARKNDVLALSILEQAAKEVGGAYTKQQDNAEREHPLTAWINSLKCSSLPVVDVVPGEVIEHEPQKQGEPEQQATTTRKRSFPGRD